MKKVVLNFALCIALTPGVSAAEKMYPRFDPEDTVKILNMYGDVILNGTYSLDPEALNQMLELLERASNHFQRYTSYVSNDKSAACAEKIKLVREVELAAFDEKRKDTEFVRDSAMDMSALFERANQGMIDLSNRCKPGD